MKLLCDVIIYICFITNPSCTNVIKIKSVKTDFKHDVISSDLTSLEEDSSKVASKNNKFKNLNKNIQSITYNSVYNVTQSSSNSENEDILTNPLNSDNSKVSGSVKFFDPVYNSFDSWISCDEDNFVDSCHSDADIESLANSLNYKTYHQNLRVIKDGGIRLMNSTNNQRSSTSKDSGIQSSQLNFKNKNQSIND